MKTGTKLEGGLEPTLFIYSNLGIQRTRTNKKKTQREWRLLSMTWKEPMTFLGEAVIHILFEVEVRLFYFSYVDSLGGNDHVSRNICSESKLVSLLEFLKVCQEFVLASM